MEYNFKKVRYKGHNLKKIWLGFIDVNIDIRLFKTQLRGLKGLTLSK